MAFELEVISTKIDRFGWGNMASAMKDRLTIDWCDVLSHFRMAEIRAACAELMDARPKDATNEQQVRAVIMKRRAKTLSAIPKQQENEPERAAPTPEEKARVSAVAEEYLKNRPRYKPSPIWKPSR